jgi:hypothetical protein
MTLPKRVVCAALRADDGTILTGIRHYSGDMHEQIKNRLDGWKFKHRHGENQGFVDTHGNYLTRSEAYNSAEANGQIRFYLANARESKTLYSENLY